MIPLCTHSTSHWVRHVVNAWELFADWRNEHDLNYSSEDKDYWSPTLGSGQASSGYTRAAWESGHPANLKSLHDMVWGSNEHQLVTSPRPTQHLLPRARPSTWEHCTGDPILGKSNRPFKGTKTISAQVLDTWLLHDTSYYEQPSS